MTRAVLLALPLLVAIALAACTSTDALQPSAATGEQAAGSRQNLPPPPSGTAVTVTKTEAAAGQPATDQVAAAAVTTDARIRFAPVVGASAEASTPLAARIAAQAAGRGISLVGAEDSSATHVMKGYFSAISETDGTTVIYVWDVLDTAGARVHRIQGKASAPAGEQSGWAGVDAGTMEAIADRTVDELATWLSSSSG